MKILITGATGLIGSEIVSLCQKQGITVHYLTTRKEKIVSSEGYKGFYWNPAKEEIDLACFDGVEAIINLAGASISKRWTKSYKKIVLLSRIQSLKTLRKGIENTNSDDIVSFVSGSAIGIYPNSLSHFYEESEKQVDASFLGSVVKEWEEEIATFKTFGCKVATIRIGLVLATEGGALPEMAKPIKNYVGAAFGSGEQWQSWIHIQDLAKIFLFAISDQLEGVYNGVGPNPVTNNKLVKAIARTLDRPLFLPNIPQFVMKAILGEMSYILFASQRVSCKKIEASGYVFDFKNVEHALEELYDIGSKESDSKTSFNKEYV